MLSSFQEKYNQAIDFYNQDNIIEAESLSMQLLEIDPFHSPTLFLLAGIFDKKNTPDVSLFLLQRILSSKAADQQVIASAHYTVATLYNKYQQPEKALFHYKEAQAVMPNHSQSAYKLALALRNIGKWEEALSYARKTIASNPAYEEGWGILGGVLFSLRQTADLLDCFEQVSTEKLKSHFALLLAISFWLENKPEKTAEFLSFISAKDLSALFGHYINALVNYRNQNPSLYTESSAEYCYMIGESHCLSPAYTHFEMSGKVYTAIPRMIMGCKIWHLIDKQHNHYKEGLMRILGEIPDKSSVIITLGEIDCRIDEGIIRYYTKHPEINLEEYIATMARNYIEYVAPLLKAKGCSFFFQGIPASNFVAITVTMETYQYYLSIIALMNKALKEVCSLYGYSFLDVYNFTLNETGTSNRKFHIDSYHLNPDYLQFFEEIVKLPA